MLLVSPPHEDPLVQAAQIEALAPEWKERLQKPHSILSTVVPETFKSYVYQNGDDSLNYSFEDDQNHDSVDDSKHMYLGVNSSAVKKQRRRRARSRSRQDSQGGPQLYLLDENNQLVPARAKGLRSSRKGSNRHSKAATPAAKGVTGFFTNVLQSLDVPLLIQSQLAPRKLLKQQLKWVFRLVSLHWRSISRSLALSVMTLFAHVSYSRHARKFTRKWINIVVESLLFSGAVKAVLTLSDQRKLFAAIRATKKKKKQSGNPTLRTLRQLTPALTSVLTLVVWVWWLMRSKRRYSAARMILPSKSKGR
jgi:hypothetical protein